jgi:GDPmannose 4,6-dehydratase
VREFVEAAAEQVQISLRWVGSGVEEKGIDARTGNCIIEIDPRYFRPAEVETLLGNPAKARIKLGWTPQTTFSELVCEMMREDLKSAERDNLIQKHGFKYFHRDE